MIGTSGTDWTVMTSTEAFHNFREDSRTPIRGIHGTRENRGINGGRHGQHRIYHNFFNNLRVAEGLLNGTRVVLIGRQKGTNERKN
jgi:hypothetical protein